MSLASHRVNQRANDNASIGTGRLCRQRLTLRMSLVVGTEAVSSATDTERLRRQRLTLLLKVIAVRTILLRNALKAEEAVLTLHSRKTGTYVYDQAAYCCHTTATLYH